ncbi:MAG: hypothetical protein M0Q52_11495 [Lascolabacillus sp.]|nr:hypothetical protein [Lascolabacillus sp.]
MLLLLGVSPSFLAHHLLNPLKKFPGNKRLMDSSVYFSGPAKLSVIDRIFEDLVDNALGNFLVALPECKTFIICFSGQVEQGIVAGGIPFKQLPYLRTRHRIGLNKTLPVALDVDVPQRGKRRIDALFRLFKHPLFGFFGQVVDIVLGHQDLDTVHKFFRRPGFLGQDDVFLHEMDLQIKLIKGYPVFEVPVQTISFLDEQGPAGHIVLGLGLFPQQLNHFGESRPARLLGRFHIHVFLNNLKSVVGSVFIEEFELGWNGEAFLLLFLGGHSCVDDGLLKGCCGLVVIHGSLASSSLLIHWLGYGRLDSIKNGLFFLFCSIEVPASLQVHPVIVGYPEKLCQPQ